MEGAVQNNLANIAKIIAAGEIATLTGHLVKSELHTGRTLIIDLKDSNSFKQVDHRTIQYIILKNVKYTLGSKSELPRFLETYKPSNDSKWNTKKLTVGDWLSE